MQTVGLLVLYGEGFPVLCVKGFAEPVLLKRGKVPRFFWGFTENRNVGLKT